MVLADGRTSPGSVAAELLLLTVSWSLPAQAGLGRLLSNSDFLQKGTQAD